VNRSPEPALNPAAFLWQHRGVFLDDALPGPVLDLACGGGHNGIFLAAEGLSVVCCDRSAEALERTRELADEHRVTVSLLQGDLEREGANPLSIDFYGGILVFRYLHRPLIPHIRASLKVGGVLMYETFTVEQPRFGKPKNPDFLLKKGELHGWFQDWEVIDFFEGIQEDPERAVAQIVCRKPSKNRQELHRVG
jgi:tellurite methyltransferase